MDNTNKNTENQDFLDIIREEIEAVQSEQSKRRTPTFVLSEEGVGGEETAAVEPVKPEPEKKKPEKKPTPEKKAPEKKPEKKPAPEKKPEKKPETKAAPEKKPVTEKKAAPEKKPAPEKKAPEKKAPEKKPAPEKKAPEKKPVTEKKKKRWKLPVILVASFIAVLAIAAVVLGTVVTNTDTVFPKVRMNGIDIGGLTTAEAADKLALMGWHEGESDKLTVKLPSDIDFTVDMIESGARLTTDAAAEAAFRYGHEGSIFQNLGDYIRCMLAPVDITDDGSQLNKDYIYTQINGAITEFTEKVTGSQLDVDLEKKVVTFFKGADKLKLEADDVFETVKTALEKGESEAEYVQPAVIVEMPDLEKIREQVFAEPKDSVYDPETHGATQEQVGVDFDVNEAKRLWNAAVLGDEIVIPLIVTEPTVTAEELSALLFRDKLGSQTSYYYGSTADRINNIKLAASKLNEVVLNPGESLSYNFTVGERTKANGFKSAAAYDNGKVVEQIGGGICQVSSTLYCATMLAQLETVDRTCHYFPVGYLPAGLDATVSWGAPDFVFRNCREYPVKIVAYCGQTDPCLTIEIWGTDVDGSYVELVSGTAPFYHDKYPEVAIGYYAYSYRNIYDKDGNLLEHRYEATSQYFYHEEDIKLPEEPTEPENPDDPGPDPIGDEPDPDEPEEPAPETPSEPDPEPTPEE